MRCSGLRGPLLTRVQGSLCLSGTQTPFREKTSCSHTRPHHGPAPPQAGTATQLPALTGEHALRAPLARGLPPHCPPLVASAQLEAPVPVAESLPRAHSRPATPGRWLSWLPCHAPTRVSGIGGVAAWLVGRGWCHASQGAGHMGLAGSRPRQLAALQSRLHGSLLPSAADSGTGAASKAAPRFCL